MIDSSIKKVSSGGDNIVKIISGGVLLWVSEAYALEYLKRAMESVTIRTSGYDIRLFPIGNNEDVSRNGQISTLQDETIKGFPDVEIKYQKPYSTLMGQSWGGQYVYRSVLRATLTLKGTNFRLECEAQSQFVGSY